MLPQARDSTRALAGALVAGAATPAGPRIVAIAGPGAGAAFPLEHGAVLGRSRSAQLRLADPAASALHLRFGLGAEGAVVEDVGSRNGATLNGRPLPAGLSLLSDGDEIRVGDTILKVEGVDLGRVARGGLDDALGGGGLPPPRQAGEGRGEGETSDAARRLEAALPLALAALALLALAGAVALAAG
jgi:hypothetical protein